MIVGLRKEKSESVGIGVGGERGFVRRNSRVRREGCREGRGFVRRNWRGGHGWLSLVKRLLYSGNARAILALRSVEGIGPWN